jgi:Transglycosylase SLT domain
VNVSGPDLLAEYRRAKEKWPFIEAAEADHDLPALLLYAVGSRETHLQNIKGDFSKRPGESSPRFHGFGVWQRDSDAFGVDESYLKDVPKQARDAAKLLADNFRSFDRWDAAIAAYNCGPGGVNKALEAGHSVDHNTTGRDYSDDVLARHAFLIAHVEQDLSVADDATKKFLDDKFDVVLHRVAQAVQFIGGRENAAFQSTKPDFMNLVMAEQALAEAKAARKAAERAAGELAKVKHSLGIR